LFIGNENISRTTTFAANETLSVHKRRVGDSNILIFTRPPA